MSNAAQFKDVALKTFYLLNFERHYPSVRHLLVYSTSLASIFKIVDISDLEANTLSDITIIFQLDLPFGSIISKLSNL